MTEDTPDSGSYADRYFEWRHVHAPEDPAGGAAPQGPGPVEAEPAPGGAGTAQPPGGEPHGEPASYEQAFSQTYPSGAGQAEERPSAGPAPAPEQAAPEPRAELAPLAARAKAQLDRNQQQLSLIEGNLLAGGGRGTIKTVYLTSCFQGEGKTTAALSAAYGLAALSRARVLLVDGSPMRPGLHPLFSAPVTPGWTDVLYGGIPMEAALHPTDVDGLHFVAAGSPSDVLGVGGIERAHAFVDRVRPCYDFVVVDGASVFSSSDLPRIAPLVDGVVFVISCERTKWEVVQDATEKVKNGGGRVLGGVLNRRHYYIPRRIYQWLSR